MRFNTLVARSATFIQKVLLFFSSMPFSRRAREPKSMYAIPFFSVTLAQKVTILTPGYVDFIIVFAALLGLGPHQESYQTRNEETCSFQNALNNIRLFKFFGGLTDLMF